MNGQDVNVDSTTGYISNDQFKDGFNQVGHYTVYLQNGVFVRNGWQKINDEWYLFNDNGTAKTGWFKDGNGLWYFFNSQGAAVTGWQSIKGLWYLFDEKNANAITGWYQSAVGNWYYLDPVNAWADTGWQYINGTWYYFDPQNAWMDLSQTLNYNWQQVMNSYWNSAAIAIQLGRNGAEYSTNNNPGYKYEVASTVKVAVLAQLSCISLVAI